MELSDITKHATPRCKICGGAGHYMRTLPAGERLSRTITRDGEKVEQESVRSPASAKPEFKICLCALHRWRKKKARDAAAATPSDGAVEPDAQS